MNDKTAIINAAQKYAAKGHIDKAISEWEKLLLERKDGNIHNTIGDLHLRKGAEQAAVESFTKAADLFKKDGFYPKAIAIYKKVLNIAPNDVDALIALAKLNADKGLLGNAIESYYRAAEIYNKEGSTEKATMVVEKMLQLSPSDVSTRSKIAYLYFRLGLRERAANEYTSIATAYLEKDNTEKAKEFFDKAIEHDPGNISALIGLSKLALKGNKHDQAFDALDNALSHDPNNKEVLFTYAKLAMDSDKNDDAKRALALLIDLDPSNIDTKKLLGTFHLKEGLVEEAWEELLPVIDNELDAEKWSEAHELMHDFKDLQTIPVKQRLLRICKAQGDDIAIYNELKELAALYEDEGTSEDALQLYKEALELNPDDKVTLEKINELEVKLGIAQPSIDIEVLSDEHIEVTENTITIPEYNEVSFPELETPPAAHIQNEETPAPPMEPEEEAALSQTETFPEEHGRAEETFELPTETEEKSDLVHVETSYEDNAATEINIMPQEPETDATPIEPAITMSSEEFAAKKAEADFYVQQGLDDEALNIYEALHAAFPDNDEITSKLSSLKSAAPSTDEVSVEIKEEPAPKSAVDDDLQALFAQFEKGEEQVVDYESHYLAGLDFRQKGLVDEAIKELHIAAKDPEKLQRNSTMLALCYMEKGSYPLAIAEFNKIIDTMTPSNSAYLHVKYELASAHLKNKEDNRALELFSEILARNPDFKDVSAIVDSLQVPTDPALEDKPKPKRDRVSYI